MRHLLLAATLTACAPSADYARADCRAQAIDAANASADRLCDGVEWERCEYATAIELQLLRSLEDCDR